MIRTFGKVCKISFMLYLHVTAVPAVAWSEGK